MGNNNRNIVYLNQAQEQPCDTNTEAAVLATLMRYDTFYNENADLLSENLFYSQTNKAIFKCIEGVNSEGHLTDINSLADYATRKGIGKDIGLNRMDFVGIVQLANTNTFKQNLDRLLTLSHRRSLWMQLQIAAQKALDLTVNPDLTVNELIGVLNDIGCTSNDTGIYTFSQAIDELNHIVLDNEIGKRTYITTGFTLFDDFFLLRPNTLTVIAAFTSVGKSALAMNIAINAARSGVGVAYYSLEMGKSELAARGLSGDAQVSASIIMNQQLSTYQKQGFQLAMEKNKNLPIYIDERSTVAFDRTIRSIRTLKKTKGIGLAVIDYLQIYTQTSDSAEASLAYMARAAKNIAKEIAIPVILLSQLNRSAAHPNIKMLRGSGQIEESADNIVLIDRPEAYPDNVLKYEGEFSDASTHGTAKLILAKGRGVGTGCRLVGFEGRYTQFYELSDTNRKEDDEPF